MGAVSSQERAFRKRLALTFKPRQYLKTSSLLVYLTTLISFYAIATVGEPIVTYFMMLIMAMMVAMVWHANNPTLKSLLSIESYKLKNAIPQIMFGIFVAFAIFLPILLATGAIFHTTPKPAGELFSQAVFNVAIIGAVEEFTFRWVFTQTMIFGAIISPILFAFMHPIVRMNWMAGVFSIESIFFFFFAVGASFLFYGLMIMGMREKGRLQKFGGLVASTSAHGTMNVIMIAFVMSIGGITLVPF